MLGDIRVLVAGLEGEASKFVRAVESYEGCEPVYINGDPDGRIPQCDAAIIVASNISSVKLRQVQDIYRRWNRPYWTVHNTWGEIKDDFERFLIDDGLTVIRRPIRETTAVGHALKDALRAVGQTPIAAPSEPRKVIIKPKWEPAIAPTQTLPPADEPTETNGDLSVEDFIKRAMEAGKTAPEITIMLDKSGYKSQRGTPFSQAAVYFYFKRIRDGVPVRQTRPKVRPQQGRFATLSPEQRSEMARMGAAARWAKAAEAKEIEPEPVLTAAPKVEETTSTPNALSLKLKQELIMQVIQCEKLRANPERQMELIEEITAGVRTTALQIIAEEKDGRLQLTQQDIFSEGDQTLLTLDKLTANALLKLVPKIREFANV